jgi:hypothetical protein
MPPSTSIIDQRTWLLVQLNMNRRLALLVLVVAAVAFIRLWPDNFTRENVVRSTPVGAREQRPSSESLAEPISAAPSVPVARGPAVANSPTMPRGIPVQIDIRAPAVVHSGESFEATVDLEADSGIQQLAFSITYDKSVLQLLGSSEGTLVKQAGVPVQFGAEEPSDGNILVNLDVGNGLVVSGTGNLAVLQFQALKAGTSPITAENITFVESGRPAASTTASVHQGVVTVD